jgi:hypothetical protein
LNNTPILTFDVDWAPDFVISPIVSILKENNIRSTWFATHRSPLIEELTRDELFEVGIHPNFQPNSTHGSNPDEVLTHMKKLFPNAKSVRTHTLLQSTPLLSLLHKFGVENDVSLLLENANYIHPFYSPFFKLYRFPSFWEDDVMMSSIYDLEHFIDSQNISGLKIFSFHPIHIFLNSLNFDSYNELKTKLGLSNMTVQNTQKYINKQHGTMTFFMHLIDSLKNKPTYTISDLQKEEKDKNV